MTDAALILTPTYFEDSDALEYVMRDVPVVVYRMDNNWSLLLDASTRVLVGFRLEQPKRAFAIAKALGDTT